ncbi:helix-turn-helix domain-containing protein [Clostridium guangxiense]|uniref:helix-turn-helix domain-containing protein n=1 Tax=Clostridium guangxiense TaxID=1662055 RepID=UPI001E33EA2B|nr:helix-turn-helix transcriptional regulator [Clostridium guangxiense]MCD2345482.1 helix-turn-helix domain-containing protein [Clostridium guangxiense]
MKDNNLKIKIIKNNIYEKVSKIFVHNLKKLIQLEGTQKKLAQKIGVSEDLLSKYKSSEAFPSIETIAYICSIYHISIDTFLNVPLSSSYFEKFINCDDTSNCIFIKNYYCYFLVTNSSKKENIHEGILKISESNVNFTILGSSTVIKEFKGSYTISDNLIFFNLYNSQDGCAYITMVKPSLNKSKYVGGIALLCLPSDANSKPCCQKIIISKVKINRKENYNVLKEYLDFTSKEKSFGNVKISRYEDEKVYDFIENYASKQC